ncbi:hypothetical protein PV04_06141 [Phialophora macrospora]|uniref:DUF7918 domain-containing protein n=1 Tax=Phialophora macrospora TaxID=1851006 RepID=A0A0D2FJA1_9EURO|nr:hypothetical protein PV04_06141 [Phialophora macrospora]
MAIIGKFEVTITSGGKVLREYDFAADDQVDHEGDKRAQVDGLAGRKRSTQSHERIFRYVEATPDANFEISYKMGPKQAFGCASHICFLTSVDGRRICSPMAQKEEYRKSGTFSSTKKGDLSICGSEMKLHRFCWTQISTTDVKPNATLAELKAMYGNKGTIRVDVWRQQSHSNDHQEDLLAPTMTSNIPECALKGRAVEVGIQFRKAERIRHREIITAKAVDTDPLATFVFFYRSKSALQILGVIPRTPEPVPLEDRDEETLTPAEMLELIRRQKAERMAEKVKIKEEKAEANLRQLAGIKREADAQDDEEISIVAQTAKKPRREVAVVELLD